MKQHIVHIGIIGLCALVVVAGAVHAGNVFIEDFTTTTYKDTLNTTAVWDTAAGELRMQPFAPTQVGVYDTPGTATGVVVAADLAFVADQSSGLHIFDITDPTTPLLLSTFNTPGNAIGVAVSDGVAFVCDGPAGLQIIDVTDPTSPALVGAHNTPDWASAVAIQRDLAFVADGLSGLQIIDITDPSAPLLAGAYSTPYAIDVEVAGQRAFVVDLYDGLQIVDITDPTSPTLMGSYSTGGNPRAVAVDGTLAYMTTTSNGLYVIDISNPATPTLVSQSAYNGTGIAVDGNVAYVANNDISILNITDPTNPERLHTYATVSAEAVALAGEMAFVADGIDGIRVIKVREILSAPVLATIHATPYDASDVAVAGNVAFVAMGSGGIRILDVTDPTSPVLIMDYPGYVYDIEISGNLAIVAKIGTIEILDIGDPWNISLLSTFPMGAQNVDVDGSLVAAAKSDVYFLDISDPENPTLLSEMGSTNFYYITIAGHVAYAGTFETLIVIDLADPSNPVWHWPAGDLPGGRLTVEGNLMFGTEGTELRVIDITNRLLPTPIGSCSLGQLGGSVAVAGNFAFVGNSSGVSIVDISLPASPILCGGYTAYHAMPRLAVRGNELYAAANDGGLYIVHPFQSDVGDFDNIATSLSIDGFDGDAYSIRFSSQETPGVIWLFTADGGDWQQVIDGSWARIDFPGSILQWQAYMRWAVPGANPTVSSLQIEWLPQYPAIESVSDIGNDQGKHVRVSWLRSGHDWVGDVTQAVEYAVYRKIDPDLGGSATTRSTEDFSAAAREHAATMLAAGWDFVASVPVLAEDSYSVIVPTLQDSTKTGGQYWTTFKVTALSATPGVFWDSPPDSGYSLDDLAPSVPANLVVSYNTGTGNSLTWDESLDPDVTGFRVYRSIDPNSTPSAETLVHATASTAWVDTEHDGAGVFYKVTAVDDAGNESEAAVAGAVTSAGASPAPATYALYPNVPNPFNPVTTIRYDVPAPGGEVSLRVYDVSGRLVTTLVSGRQTAGAKSVTWSGRDDTGSAVASGVYFYRLSAPGYDKTHKMVLTK